MEVKIQQRAEAIIHDTLTSLQTLQALLQRRPELVNAEMLVSLRHIGLVSNTMVNDFRRGL